MVKLFDDKFEDINGRKYRRYTVRKIGNTYSPFDKYRNMFIIANADQYQMTRAQAWEYLKAN